MNVLGGYGYLEEYEISQSLRDAKIAQIYEGTNDIHQAALATRLSGAPHQAFLAELKALCLSIAEVWEKARVQVLADSDPRFIAAEFLDLSALCLAQALFDNSDLPEATWPHSIGLARLRSVLAREVEIAASQIDLTLKHNGTA